jgi:rare lipoprotein A
MRAVFAGTSAGTAAAPPLLTTTVYRQSLATIYGPGFYGRRTACGQRLTRATIGVASRTLTCGTKVALYFQGRTMIVPVIDRGPYANDADWDLTTATARALEMTGTESLGAVSLPLQPSATLAPIS